MAEEKPMSVVSAEKTKTCWDAAAHLLFWKSDSPEDEMNKTPSATMVINCGKCGRFMMQIDDISPTEHFPALIHIAPCAGCAVDRKFLEEIAKPVEEREGYTLTNSRE